MHNYMQTQIHTYTRCMQIYTCTQQHTQIYSTHNLHTQQYTHTAYMPTHAHIYMNTTHTHMHTQIKIPPIVLTTVSILLAISC